jgi:5-methylcytosine-specific restriction endonuclease McrA
MPHKDPAQRQKYKQDWYQKNKETELEQKEKSHKNRKKHAYDSITSGSIIDPNTWDKWCNIIKSSAKAKKQPYSDDFTNNVMFEMMVQGCFYCGDVATTIDRIDSKIEHTLDNCVGSCYGCNNSKGTANPDTFIRKAYYRARGTYYDDTDVWYEHKTKPAMNMYKRKKVPFELTKDEWDKLVVGECAYCHRSPTTWFGVDRIVPSLGYISDNVATCCFDCNVDKFVDDVDTMRARNERIAQRMDDGKLVIGDHEKVILHKGKHSSSVTVCAYGKMYETQRAAARAIKKSSKTIEKCICDGTDPEIFAVTKEFYEKYKDIENITKDMFDNFV